MTLNQLASAVAKLEGKRSQTSIGNVRETIRCTLDYLANSPEAAEFLGAQLTKRVKKVKKPKAVK